MASLADELLADLGSDGSADERDNNAPSPVANGKKRAHPDQDAEDGVHDQDNAKAAESDNKRIHLDDADLDDLDGDETMQEDDDEQDDSGMQLGRNAVKPADEIDQQQVEQLDMTGINSVNSIAKLMASGKLDGVVKQIEHFMSLPEPDTAGVLEDSPEYQLIVKSNNLAVDVDNEVMLVHKFIRDHYAPRFPELETLILNPWEFVQAVKAIGNTEDISQAKLEGILPHGTVVVISMTASTTSGHPLDPATWARVQEACELVFELERVRRTILEYVESRMTFIAPNLSAVVGTRTATKLLGVAGGLEGLSKIPACNLHLLGASRKAAIGFSSVHNSGGAARSSGFISQSELVQETPDEYKRQAVRMVSAKALLAARMDAGRTSSRDGSYGWRLHGELTKRLEKLQEPPPSKLDKVLPIPKEGGNKKRRGGRKARKAKERYGMTELRKLANRVEFGKVEEEALGDDESVGLGMIRAGRVRAQGAEERSQGKISRANKNRLNALKPQLDGTASSLSFTPVQGIELVDPERQRKVEDANARWFREGQFSLLPGAGTGSKLPGSMLPPPPPPPKK